MNRDFIAMQVLNLPPWQFLQPERPTSMDHNQGGNVASVEVDLRPHKEAGQSLLCDPQMQERVRKQSLTLAYEDGPEFQKTWIKESQQLKQTMSLIDLKN